MDTYREGDWEARAACKGAPVDDFFRAEGGKGPGVTAMVKKLCASCEVRAECLEAALAEEGGSKARWGYRGGKTPNQRRNIHNNRVRARRLADKLATRAGRRSDAESTYR